MKTPCAKLNDDHLVNRQTASVCHDEKTAFKCAQRSRFVEYASITGHRVCGRHWTADETALQDHRTSDNGKHMTWITEIRFPSLICIMSKRSGIVSKPRSIIRKQFKSSHREIQGQPDQADHDDRQAANGVRSASRHASFTVWMLRI